MAKHRTFPLSWWQSSLLALPILLPVLPTPYVPRSRYILLYSLSLQLVPQLPYTEVQISHTP